MNWLACRVATGKEYSIRGKLALIDPSAEIYIPRRNFNEVKDKKVIEKSERMLPGYILIGSEKGINPLLLSDFLKVIGEVTEAEIALLRAQEGQKTSNLGVGSKILVIDGPFQGCKGNIQGAIADNLDCRLVFQGIEIKAKIRKDFVSVIK